jgi:hypothetical protein
MSTPVSFVVCNVHVNPASVDLATLCPPSNRVVLTTTVEELSALSEAFDYTYASAVWSLAFTSVVGFYLVAKHAGMILALIRGR